MLTLKNSHISKSFKKFMLKEERFNYELSEMM
jgi:hypothetical protein